MSKFDLLSTVYGEEGYSLNLKLSPSDLATLQAMIRIQWLYRIQLLVPKHVHKFYESGIERYHEHADLIDHSKSWSKTSRVLPKEAVDIIRKMDFFKKLEEECEDIIIADEEKLGWENIYWRLVRPGNSDFGSLHTENWFVNLGYYGSEINDNTREKIKIWISIHTTPGKNGLVVVPKSHHKKDWKWHAEERYGLKKPVIDEDLTKINAKLLSTEPGRAVVFHYDLLHGGAENLADTTRVSVELTFLVKKSVINELRHDKQIAYCN